jgi:hypothetical protein
MLAGDLVRPAHRLSQRLAVAEFFEFLGPGHVRINPLPTIRHRERSEAIQSVTRKRP